MFSERFYELGPPEQGSPGRPWVFLDQILPSNHCKGRGVFSTGSMGALKVRQSRNDFFKPTFPPKTNERILLYYYGTSGRLVFARFLEEIEDTKKTFKN